MIGLDVNISAKSAVMWIMLKQYYLVKLILNSIWFISVLYCKFWAFRIILFYIAYFYFFYPRINEPNLHNDLISISSFQSGLNNFFGSIFFYFNSKVIEGSHKEKNKFFNFWGTFWGCDIFFWPRGCPVNSIFQ